MGRRCPLLKKCCEMHCCMLRDVCLPNILFIADSEWPIRETIELYRLISNILNLFILCQVKTKVGLLRSVKSYVLSRWNHRNEVLCWTSCDILCKLAKLHQIFCSRECEFLKEIFEDLQMADDNIKAKYIALKQFVHTIDGRYALKRIPLDDFVKQSLVSMQHNVQHKRDDFALELCFADMSVGYSNSWSETWIQPAIVAAECPRLIKYLTKIIKKHRRPALNCIAEHLCSSANDDVEKLLSKEHLIRLILKSCDSTIDSSFSELVFRIAKSYIYHPDLEIAFSSLRWLSNYPKHSVPFEQCQLECVLNFLKINASHGFSEEVYALISKILQRMDNSLQHVKKYNPDQLAPILVYYKVFYDDLFNWSLQSLDNYILYFGRNAALRLVELLITARFRNVLCIDLDQFRQKCFESLLEALADAYERNQLIAFNLLRTMQSNLGSSPLFKSRVQWSKNVLGSTFRLREVFTAVYYLRLEAHVCSASLCNWALVQIRQCQSAVKACVDASSVLKTHSIFGIVSLWKFLFLDNANHADLSKVDCITEMAKELSEICYELTCTLLPILQDSELDHADSLHLEGGYAVDRQTLVLTSWRVVKESNDLLTILCATLAQLDDGFWLRRLFNHFLYIFSKINHRGVFETAGANLKSLLTTMTGHVVFENCRLQCIEMVLNRLETDAQAFKLTMRSGGLPILVTSLLGQYSSPKNDVQVYQAFDSVIVRLIDASDVSKQSKINCLNILNIAVRDKSFVKLTRHHLPAIFRLAFVSLANEDLMIRNAAQLLYAAWNLRFFGVDPKSKLSDVDVNKSHPELFSLVESRLKIRASHNWSDGCVDIYVSLAVLSRVYPSSSTSKLTISLWPLVSQVLLLSRSERFRQMASEALVSIMPPYKLRNIWMQIHNRLAKYHVYSQKAISGLLYMATALNSSDHGDVVTDDHLIALGDCVLSWCSPSGLVLFKLLSVRSLLFVFSPSPSEAIVCHETLMRFFIEKEQLFSVLLAKAAVDEKLRLNVYKSLIHSSLRFNVSNCCALAVMTREDILTAMNERLMRKAVKVVFKHGIGASAVETFALTQRRKSLKNCRSVAHLALWLACTGQPGHQVVDVILSIVSVSDFKAVDICLRSLFHLSKDTLAEQDFFKVVVMIILQKMDSNNRRRAAILWLKVKNGSGLLPHPDLCFDKCVSDVALSFPNLIFHALDAQIDIVADILNTCLYQAPGPFMKNDYEEHVEAPTNLLRLANAIIGRSCCASRLWREGDMQMDKLYIEAKINRLLQDCCQVKASVVQSIVLQSVVNALRKSEEALHKFL